MKVIKKIAKIVEENDSFLVISHIHPDGDAIGSSVALGEYLKYQRDKEVSYLLSKYSSRFNFLIDNDLLSREIPDKDPDVVLILDSSSPDRIAQNHHIKFFDDSKLINIDHHPHNYFFGAVNWVNDQEPAVGSMIFKLLRYLEANFTKRISQALYTAIVTDTARFTSPKTNPEVLSICSSLAQNGIDLNNISSNIYYSYGISYLRNVSIALSDFGSYLGDKIIFLTIDQESIENHSSSLEETDGIVDLTMVIRSVLIGVLFKEVEEEYIRVSFRGRGNVNILPLATDFGGGGHSNAAGCTVRKSLEETQEIILNKCKILLSEAREVNIDD